MKNLLAVFFICSLLTSCSHHFPWRGPSGEANLTEREKEIQKYNTLFPYYAQVCTTTQYVRRSGKFDAQGKEILEKGGNGGHATMFLKGVCPDYSKDIPQLKICDDNVDLTSYDSGTGVSVNDILDNVNWIAIPGRKLFFHGGLNEEDTLSVPVYEQIIAKAAKSGWYKGIRIKDEALAKYTKKFKMTTEELRRPENIDLYNEIIARESIGTDFAMTFARNGLCARVPFPRDRMEKLISYMNNRNREAQEKSYTWDFAGDNCSHTTSNAFASTGMYDYKKISYAQKDSKLETLQTVGLFLKAGLKIAVGQMPDISVPANNVLRIVESVFERDIASAKGAFKDKNTRITVLDDKPWLATSHGALLEFVPIRPVEKNQMFVAGIQPVVAGDFIFKNLKKKYDKYRDNQDPENLRYFDLETNLKYYVLKYNKILKNKLPTDSTDPEFLKFYQNFYTLIEKYEIDAQDKLKHYESLK